MIATILLIYITPVCLAVYAWRRADGSFGAGIRGWLEQLAKILPTMVVALIGAGFLTALIPERIIRTLLGGEYPVLEILVGSVTGLLFPTGPVVVFSLAASFSQTGASNAALVAFLTSWTLFALHRMVIFELPLLGKSFVKVRVLSIMVMPVLTGSLVVLLDRMLRWIPVAQ